MAYALKTATDRELNEREAVLQMKIDAGADDGCREEVFAIGNEQAWRATRALRAELKAAFQAKAPERDALLALVAEGQPVPVYHLNAA